jgi:hypothetical protein
MGTEEFVANLLGSMGFNVRRVDCGKRKTPDLLVSDKAATYLIEIKDKLPDSEKMERRADVLSRGAIWSDREGLDYSNAISRVVRDGAEQLAAYQDGRVDFRLVWLLARGHHSGVRLEQIKATLFGCAEIIDEIDTEDGPECVGRPCFYFRESEFYRGRAVLDGAFIATDESCLLCINSYSPRANDFVATRFCKSFRPGVCHPKEQENAGDAFIADCHTDRNDRDAVLAYVREKYGRPWLIACEPIHDSAEVFVRRPGPDAT